MANLNAVSVPVATEHKTKLDLSFDHVTTMGFMRVQPVLYRRMIRGEHDKITCSSSVRPAPIEVPFFGSLVQNIRYFAVKLNTIFPNWYSFINDNIASNASDSSLVGGVPIIPAISLQELFSNRVYDASNQINLTLGLFWNSARFFSESRTINGVNYSPGLYTTASDYIPVDAIGTDSVIELVDAGNYLYDYKIGNNYYRLTHIGRRFMTLLATLGYKPIWGVNKDTAFNYNALNLLALARVYIDWYANSQYLNSWDILYCEKLFKYNDPTGQLVLTHQHVFTILNMSMRVIYDTDDYFVNAYDQPSSAVNGQFSGFQVFDPTSLGGAYVQTNIDGTPQMVSPDSASIGTAYIHEALRRLTDYQKRHQLSARSIDRALAQYGAVPTNLRNERSIYLGHQSNVIKSGAVMSTGNGTNAEGQSSSVGDYSGAGFGQSQDSIEYVAEDDCIILGLATIIPQGNIVQGYDRNNRALTRFDFFQPELDFGVKAIEKGEVYVSKNSDFASIVDGLSDYEQKFGFTGQYGELKRPKSMLTGDFTFDTVMQGGDSWHLFRLFDDESFAGSAVNLVHSLSFTKSDDNGQYYRIFQYVGDDVDPFYCFMHFDFAALAPCKPLFDTYDFEASGKKIDISNGNKVN